MIKQDYVSYRTYFPLWYSDEKSFCLLSPNEEQEKLIRTLFPQSTVTVKRKEDWDLNKKIKDKYDIIIAMNVFHYSPDPELWFNNVFNSCKQFWIQDLVSRKRGTLKDTELDQDGDSARYQFLPDIHSTLLDAFDVNFYKDRILYLKTYKGDKDGSLHFMCKLKGDIE